MTGSDLADPDTLPDYLPGAATASTAIDDAALAAFVAEHYDRLLRLAWLVCRDATVAPDAVQAGLEQAWRRRGTLRDEAKLKPWLDRVVVRETIRVSKAHRSWLDRLFGSKPADGEDGPAEMADRVPAPSAPLAEWAAFRVAFASLSADQRAVVVLHLHEGYTVAETAELVGAPLDTVRSRLRLARERLRRELGEEAP